MKINNILPSTIFKNLFTNAKTLLNPFKTAYLAPRPVAIGLSTAALVGGVVYFRALQKERSLLTLTKESLLTLAKEYRTDSSATSKEQEAIRKQAIQAEAYGLLKDYSAQKDLETAIRALVTDNYNLRGSIELIDTKTTTLKGKSRDLVYIIKEDKQVIGYVKVFIKPASGKFLEEVSGIQLIQEMNIPKTDPIKILGFGRYDAAQRIGPSATPYAMLFMSPAVGLRTDRYVKEKQVNALAKTAFRRIGESFAYVHQRKTAEKFPLSKKFLESYQKKIKVIETSSLLGEKLFKQVSREDFLRYVHGIRESAKGVSIPHTYTLPDSHLGNMFYDDKQDRVVFIDLDTASRSVTRQGEPTGEAFTNFSKIEKSLDKLSPLPSADKALLIDAFYEGYKSQGGEMPSASLKAMSTTYAKLGNLADSASMLEKGKTDGRDHARIVEDMITHFKEKITEQRNAGRPQVQT